MSSAAIYRFAKSARTDRRNVAAQNVTKRVWQRPLRPSDGRLRVVCMWVVIPMEEGKRPC